MRILLAEDEKELSNALVAILKHNNYSVDAVYNGHDALAYLSAENYDGAVLDVMMPGPDGIAVLKKIREKGITLPVLMLTAKSEIDNRVEGLDAGADDYLTKPFSSKELLARLRAITRRPAEFTGTLLSAGNTSLSRTSFQLSAPGGVFRLAGKEFQIMEMLMANPHQIIPSETFLERIWGYDTDSEINIVWVYISYLRKKLLAIGSNIQIRAARGVGYALETADS